MGKWEYWEGNNQIQLEVDLYNTPTDGSYGTYNVFEGGYGLTYSIVNVYHIDSTEASVVVENSMRKQKAEFKYSPTTKGLSFLPPDSESIVSKQKDEYNYIFISGGDKVSVRSTLVSGSSLMKADRGQSFRFLGEEKGWFKVKPSAQDKRIGHISPKYAFYLRDNTIPEHASSKNYTSALASFTLEEGGEQVFMVKTTVCPPQSESIPMSSVESYAGEMGGNALVFTYLSGMSTQDINEMSKVEPYVVYYWKESGIFIMEGENYTTDM